MSSPKRSLAFRDSIETSAGETKRILSEDPTRTPTVTFSNHPIVYYYDQETPFHSSKCRYLEIPTSNVYLSSSNNNSKCFAFCKSHIKIYMIYLCIIFSIVPILFVIIFLLFNNLNNH